MYKRVVTLLISLSLCIPALSKTVNFVDCSIEQKQLGLCQQLVKDLDSENALLKQKIELLTKQRDMATNEAAKDSEPPIVPGWALILIGVVVGAGTYAAIRR